MHVHQPLPLHVLARRRVRVCARACVHASVGLVTSVSLGANASFQKLLAFLLVLVVCVCLSTCMLWFILLFPNYC